MEKQYGLFLVMLCCFSFVGASIDEEMMAKEAHNYWKMRGDESRIRNEQAYRPDPFNVTNNLNYRARELMEDVDGGSINTKRMLKKYRGPCKATNPIDSCWRCRQGWEKNRQKLAKCALGFGSGTTGGMGGREYVVTDSSDNDMVNPKPGTLRHAVIQTEPLWIVFSTHMTIKLNQELIMTGHKTIDGRGANVVLQGGAQITIQNVENIIIHGIKIRNSVEGNGGMIRDSVNHYGLRTKSDGDGISIMGSHHIWIDHVSLTRCYDGLIDAIDGSTAITISNCHMVDHERVFLFGAHRQHTQDRKMQITIAYNHFGKKLNQRMPRCRWGFFHIVNNDYTHWENYAIGGSENPTIISQGNRFIASPLSDQYNEVTHREMPDSPWDSGTWRSENDEFQNGATFKESGGPYTIQGFWDKIIQAMPGKLASEMTKNAGPLKCMPKLPC